MRVETMIAGRGSDTVHTIVEQLSDFLNFDNSQENLMVSGAPTDVVTGYFDAGTTIDLASRLLAMPL